MKVDYFFFKVKKPRFLCSSFPGSSVVLAGSVWDLDGMLVPSGPVTEFILPIHRSRST